MVNNLPTNARDVRDMSSIPESGGHGNPFQYTCLENPTQATVHTVAKSRTRPKQCSTHRNSSFL